MLVSTEDSLAVVDDTVAAIVYGLTVKDQVTADAGATNVYLILGKYYAESLSANVNDATVKKTGARTWRVMKSATPIEFDVYFDASAYGGEVITKHFVVNF